ncbi:MAG: hypothetical protein GPOALKHO_001722 [Sodalis sp.]|nr:MAG: hypothetical protein GPOALKHO_001722 [Sodalis sp.]
MLVQPHGIPDISLQQLTPRHISQWVSPLQQWRIQPNGTEDYRTVKVVQDRFVCMQCCAKAVFYAMLCQGCILSAKWLILSVG